MKKNSFEVRGVTFGEGIPVIAVPVIGNEEGIILSEVTAAKGQTDMLEVRIDAFLGIRDTERVSRILREIRGAFDGPILFTLRTKREGGLCDVNDAFYEEILTLAVTSGSVDLVDVEMAFGEIAERLIQKAHSRGVKAVVSQHDFANTPGSGEICDALRRMYGMGADIAKGAYMPRDAADVDRVLAAGLKANREFARPFVLISMGEYGQMTRTEGEVFGSCMTFACPEGKESAPGQINVADMRKLLSGRHEALMERKNIFLIGFMGAGKTSVSSALGTMTGRRVVEMDRRIEEEQGMSIPQIFERYGQEYFRNLETELLMGLGAEEPSIVSCGGGAVLRARNVVLMKGTGKIVLLDVSAGEVLKRLANEVSGRPNLKDRFTLDGIRELQDARREAYEGAADITVLTDGREVLDIAQEIYG